MPSSPTLVSYKRENLNEVAYPNKLSWHIISSLVQRQVTYSKKVRREVTLERKTNQRG